MATDLTKIYYGKTIWLNNSNADKPKNAFQTELIVLRSLQAVGI